MRASQTLFHSLLLIATASRVFAEPGHLAAKDDDDDEDSDDLSERWPSLFSPQQWNPFGQSRPPPKSTSRSGNGGLGRSSTSKGKSASKTTVTETLVKTETVVETGKLVTVTETASAEVSTLTIQASAPKEQTVYKTVSIIESVPGKEKTVTETIPITITAAAAPPPPPKAATVSPVTSFLTSISLLTSTSVVELPGSAVTVSQIVTKTIPTTIISTVISKESGKVEAVTEYLTKTAYNNVSVAITKTQYVEVTKTQLVNTTVEITKTKLVNKSIEKTKTQFASIPASTITIAGPTVTSYFTYDPIISTVTITAAGGLVNQTAPGKESVASPNSEVLATPSVGATIGATPNVPVEIPVPTTSATRAKGKTTLLTSSYNCRTQCDRPWGYPGGPSTQSELGQPSVYTSQGRLITRTRSSLEYFTEVDGVPTPPPRNPKLSLSILPTKIDGWGYAEEAPVSVVTVEVEASATPAPAPAPAVGGPAPAPPAPKEDRRPASGMGRAKEEAERAKKEKEAADKAKKERESKSSKSSRPKATLGSWGSLFGGRGN